ncbi:MAG: rhodanese-like domain-containing protein [Rivularia sp. T60_A2020_040]|nr:rhodanese-like domain-containing protein [Rivularia sp. T60_A2020_040]
MTGINQEKVDGELQVIDAKTLKECLEEGTILLIDVREAAEYAGERIPGARRLSLSTFEPEKIRLEQGKKLILHCQSGRRSAQAAQKLFAAGFEQVTHLEGGLNAWKQAGYPVETSKNAPISIMRQVQIVAGSLVVIGTLLGAFISPWFLILSGFVGSGLVFAGVTNTCALGMLLAQMPWNKK